MNWLLVMLATSAAMSASADEASLGTAPATYVQVWLGGLGTDEQSWDARDVQSGQSVLGDLGTLPFGGGAGQLLWGSGAWQIGYEGGGLTSWKNDKTEFRGTNGTLLVDVDNTFYSFGVFMGAVVSVQPSRYLRLYVAGGPSLTWAWVQEDHDNAQSGNATVDLGDEDAGSFVAYGRAGVEVVLDNGFAFGASVRYADDEFDFGDAGKLTLDEPLWLLTLGARLR